ncbi:MAG: LysR family transcriptional regulator [Burkholderiales bacterium]|jgi:DNA-binding transcriptional LysR family regulator|nr:LysR family transcriptional regulator [Burkholderiales bacterium]
MRRIPNFVLLRAFEAAARLESFTLAAHELHLTPSAISHQVRELEDYFARPLFVRKNRRVEPTPEGRRLFHSLARILDAMEAACGEVTLAPHEQVLALHCAPSFAVKWLGPRLPEFLRTHPNVTVRLSTGAEPIDLTRVRDVDVVISYGFAQERSGLDVRALGAESIVPLCSPRLLEHDMPDEERLASLCLIESQLSQVTWRDWFLLNELHQPPRPRLSFDRAALAISAAVDAMGITLESARLAEKEMTRGELVLLGGGRFKAISRATHFFSQRSNERHIEKVRAFRQWLFSTLGIDEAPA